MNKPIRYILIDPDARSITEAVDVLDLAQMQKLVRGYIELACRALNGVPCSLFINEEGRLEGLTPFFLANQYGSEHFCGPMIVLGPGDDDGNNTGTDMSVVDVAALVTWLIPDDAIPGHTATMAARVYTDAEQFHVCIWDPLRFTWDPSIDWKTAELKKNISVYHYHGAELGLLPASMRHLYTPGKVLTPHEFTLARTYIDRALDMVRERTGLTIKEDAGIENPGG